ncbi:UPF0158 family protein [Gracilibacillus massiliensis]|uniref:UPF0158 family protein n=1 Tax=Gracilibacillus massiliensis TaxID=1564956 RepID=UPI00071D64CC|nr:UPF0158 family protein [Gracilibacillus massiliensis]
MSAKVKLRDLIDEMEMQSEEFEAFLTKETGKVVLISSGTFLAAEDEDFDRDRLADWELEEVDTAIDILENDHKYAELPSEYEINEYNMMERFCFSLEDDAIQSALLNAIQGRGAFRRFKDQIITLGVRDEWFEFRDDCYKQIAIDFCERVEIDYEE